MRTRGKAFRWAFWGGAAIGLTVVLFLAFRPRPVTVDVGSVIRGPMSVVVQDEARTRVRDLYVVSAPVSGRLLRLGERAGRTVAVGEVVAVLQPAPPIYLDERALREAQAGERAAESAVTFAEADLRRQEAEAAQATRELERVRTLSANGFASQAAVDRAALAARSAAAQVAAARAEVAVRRAELAAAHARRADPSDEAVARREVAVRAPVAGRILRVLQQSETVVAQGAPLLEIGDPRALEIEAELLSSDAARVRAGARATVTGWEDGQILLARVRLVEPYGFLKVSALGVEEQRVRVILDPIDPPAAWNAVGHGYRVEVAIEVWRASSVIQCPVAALFRHKGQWAVFRLEEGRARLRRIAFDASNGETVEVRSGLAAGDRVVLYPSQDIRDGVRLRERIDSLDA